MPNPGKEEANDDVDHSRYTMRNVCIYTAVLYLEGTHMYVFNTAKVKKEELNLAIVLNAIISFD